MKVNMELDGEPISIEQSSPSDNSTGLNQREDFPYFNNSFNNADGMINHADSEGRIKYVIASAAQNTPNYFDQDNYSRFNQPWTLNINANYGYSKIKDIKQWIKQNNIKNHVFLFSASTFSNLAIYELYKEFPDNSYVDIGTCLTPMMDMPTHRDYLTGFWSYKGSRTLNEICVWN
jgi:hypothetical protein